MTIDELIRDLEKCEYVNGSSGYKIEEVACKIALATLKAHKNGLRMSDPTEVKCGDRLVTILPRETELDEILKGLV